MRFRLIVAAAIAGAGATGIAHARLTAQDASVELTGCHDVTLGPWVVETYARRLEPRPRKPGDHESERIPPRMEFAGPHDRWPAITRIATPDLGWSLRYEFMNGGIEGDSLRLVFSDGFTGMRASLYRSGDGWTGTARTFSDYIPHQINARPVTLSPADCESAAPPRGGETHPLPRFVDLEGGEVIALGAPLPDQLETVALPPYVWNWPPILRDSPTEADPLATPRNAVAVVGRTRRLFSSTDSIQVHTDPDGMVYSIRLLYADPGALATLQARFRSAYGAPETRPGVPDVHMYRSAATSLWLRPEAAGRAEVLLSDRWR